MYIDKDRFPFELPLIYVNTEKQKYIPNIPHITSGGYICYLDKEGVVWSDNIDKVFDFIFERIESILFQNESIEGIHREFQYYFSQVKNLEYMYSFIAEGDLTRKVKLHVSSKRKSKFVFDTSEKDDFREEKEVNSQIVNGIYIPFVKPLDIYVPNKSKFWSGKEISGLIERCVTKENIDIIRYLTKYNRQNYYILNILLADGQNVLIGLKYENMYDEKSSHKKSVKEPPIIQGKNDMKITPIFIERIDDNKTLTRGGAITNGKEFNILVIGCGSVGSEIVFQLSRSGFKNITIVDYDKFSEENIYRHFLGKSRVKDDNKKVTLMKKELESRYDEINITTYDTSIFNLLENNLIDLKEYSLVISAIGDVNKERLLNKYILKSKTPIIYSWVEAYGLGGHAVLINKEGCYNCLITEELRCRVNFAGKSDKPFVKNHGGCLGTFTPYGGMDSTQTAIITARLVHETLIDNLERNKVVSWKGNEKMFTDNGYEVDKSYYNFKVNIGERYDITLKGCAYCND